MSQATNIAITLVEPIESDIHPILGEYIDCLSASLVGLVPYPERTRLKSETLNHLEELFEQFIRQGCTNDEAAEKAIETYGDSDTIANQFSESYVKSRRTSPLLRRIGYGPAIAFSIFSVPVFALTVLCESRTHSPSSNARLLPHDLGLLHRIVPNNLVLPEWNLTFMLLFGILLLTPIFGGLAAGRLIPSNAVRSVVEVLPLLCLYSFLVGFFMLPMNEMLICAVFQVFYWIPVAMFTTRAASALQRINRLAFGKSSSFFSRKGGFRK